MKVAVHRGFFEALAALGKEDQRRTWDAIEKLRKETKVGGLRWHQVSNGFVSLSPTMAVRLIAQHENDKVLLLHVARHDNAYTWADRHRLVADAASGALELFPLTVAAQSDSSPSWESVAKPYGSTLVQRLVTAGVPMAIAQEVEGCLDENAMLARVQLMSPEWQEIVFRVACGETITPDEIPHQSSLVRALSSDETLARALEMPLASWRYFLHPRQRQAVEDLGSRLVVITGGPGTGKSVVCAHRAALITRTLKSTDVVIVFGLALNLVSYLRNMIDGIYLDEPGWPRRIWTMPCDNVIDRPDGVRPVVGPSEHLSVGIADRHCYLYQGGRRRRVAAIVVDEAHDSPNWFLAFLQRVITETSCQYVTLALDRNQTIFNTDNRQTLLDLTAGAHYFRLPYSFRMTRQLIEHAFSVLQRYAPVYADQLDLSDGLRMPVATLTGPKVRYVVAGGTAELLAHAEAAVRDLRTRYPDDGSLAVVHLQYASSHFRRRGRVDPVQEALKTSPIIGRYYKFAFWEKGLEYYAGVVVCPSNYLARDLGPDDILLRLNTMFVALTRFRDELTVVYERDCPAARYLAFD